MVTEKVTEEQRLWLVQLRHRGAGQTQAKVIRYLAQDLPAPALSAVNALTSYSRRSYCFGLMEGKWSDFTELLYLSTEHLRGANDCLRYHGLCNGSLNDSLKSADKDICYFPSGQTASSSSSSSSCVLVSCVSEFKVTSLMSCMTYRPLKPEQETPFCSRNWLLLATGNSLTELLEWERTSLQGASQSSYAIFDSMTAFDTWSGWIGALMMTLFRH